MPLTPGGAPEPFSRYEGTADAGQPQAARDVAQATEDPPKKSWHGRLLIICFAIFAFEIGLFLTIFPWMDAWNANNLQDLSPQVQQLWSDPYFRGALTGLGLINLYVAFRQLFGLLRRT